MATQAQSAAPFTAPPARNPSKRNKAREGFKTVDGTPIPRDQFAFIGDANKRSTWKLPHDTEGRAKDALSRFKHTRLPRDQRRAVADRVAKAARSFGIDTSGFEAKYLKNPSSKRNDSGSMTDSEGVVWHMTFHEIGNGMETAKVHSTEGSFSIPATPWDKIIDRIAQRIEEFPVKNPSGQKRKAKRNLDEIDQAAQLASEFKGSPAEEVREVTIPAGPRDDFAHLGWLDQWVFMPPYETELPDMRDLSDFYHERVQTGSDPFKTWNDASDEFGVDFLVFDLTGDEIDLVSSADGKQLAFIGQRQKDFAKSLEIFETDTSHDAVDLGYMVSLTYTAQKEQAGDTEPHPYYHVLGEDDGTPPRAHYEVLNKRVVLVGGTYHLKEADKGIIN